MNPDIKNKGNDGSSEEDDSEFDGQKKVDCENAMIETGLMNRVGEYYVSTVEVWERIINVNPRLFAFPPVDHFITLFRNNNLAENYNTPGKFCTAYAMGQIAS
uniref:Uncharacterized protein n=1 Tax=Schizaphis graminum TaxID=13262 RepID=A0A2S2PP38_SCHGA